MDLLFINQFKCFIEASVPINQLTLLTGCNGNGKSTVVQSLLYLRRTIEHCGEWNKEKNEYIYEKANGLNVPLNGSYCLALGTSSGVLNRQYTINELSMGYSNMTETIEVSYWADDRTPKLWLVPSEIVCDFKDNNPLFKQEFYYLNAERLGPRISQSMQFWDYPNAGWQGEYTAQLLNLEEGFFKVEPERKHYDTESLLLKDQVNAWLNFIMPGTKVQVKSNHESLMASILLQNDYTDNEPAIATNLGFGISYILPIIATGLTAKKGSFFIVENPEAHLHPSAQSRIGRFLAMVAASGIKVVIETHSDHVINGIQISVASQIIDHEKVTINYFSKKENYPQPDILPISISKKGELTDWPKGFFDQTQLDYSFLYNIHKHE